MQDVFQSLESTVYSSLETYSNVHRGSGLFSQVTTALYEQARIRVLDFFKLGRGSYVVVFCSGWRAKKLCKQLQPDDYKLVSSKEFGLYLGVYALAIRKSAIPKGAPEESGGGTTRLVSPEWILWAKAPDRFEAGTPAIVNIIAFGRALQLVENSGKDVFGSAGNFSTQSPSDIMHKDDLQDCTGDELMKKLNQQLIGRDVQVPTLAGSRPFVNLDNAASTPAFIPVWDAFRQTLGQQRPRQEEIVEEVRTICAGFLDAPLTDFDVMFTSNTTEAINLAADSLARESDGIEPVVCNTLLEHSANDLPWRRVSKDPLIRLSINENGFIDLHELDSVLQEYNQDKKHGSRLIKLVAVCGASNALGVYNDLAAISKMVHRYGARLFVDGAQMVAHRRVAMMQTGIDYLAFSGHKVYAPFGCGALVVRKGILKFSQEELQAINSSGEENAAGIAALGKSLLLLQRIGLERIQAKERAITAKLLRGMNQVEGISIFGTKDTDSPDFVNRGGVVIFTMKKAMSNVIARELAVRGIGIRYGCHCAHILIKHVLGVGPRLEKFQKLMLTLLPAVQLPGAARVSLGIQTTEEEVELLVDELKCIATGKESSDNLKRSGKIVHQETKEFIQKMKIQIFSEVS